MRDSLDKFLSAYAATATAAGVSLAALSPVAEGKVVYTPANDRIAVNTPFPLDLNHDGQADFSISNRSVPFSNSALSLLQVEVKAPGNAIWGKGSFRSSSFFQVQGIFASALRPGFKVQPSKHYLQKSSVGILAFSAAGNLGTSSQGQWLYTKNRYLGLKFMIKGEVHYGWARFDVAPGHGIQTTLTGYAYETVPNKPIITGKTKGPDVTTVDPASLGHLAAGASAMPAWRSGRRQ